MALKTTLNSSRDWQAWITSIEVLATEYNVWRFINPNIKEPSLHSLTRPTKPKYSDVKAEIKDRELVFYSMLTDEEKNNFHQLMKKYTIDKEISKDLECSVKLLKSTILHSIHPKLLCHVHECDTVHQMLVNLSNRFALNNNCHKKEEDSYYDNYLMTVGLMKSCKFGTTDFKIIPKSFSAKVHDVYDYCTKKLVITYPDGKISEFLRIPNVVLYKERSLDFNKTGVFLGVPRVFTKTLQSCLQSIIINPLFEDKVIKSDKNYWWTQAILSDTFVGNNCIFIISIDEDGNYIEETFSSFEELFEKTSSSVLINIQCNILLTSKVPVEKIGMEWPEDLSRMSIVANSINVTDLSDVPKPKLWQPIKARVSPKDVASDALLERLALR